MKKYENYEQVGNLALEGFEAYGSTEEDSVESSTPQEEQYFEYIFDIKLAVSMDQDDFCTAFMYA